MLNPNEKIEPINVAEEAAVTITRTVKQ